MIESTSSKRAIPDTVFSAVLSLIHNPTPESLRRAHACFIDCDGSQDTTCGGIDVKPPAILDSLFTLLVRIRSCKRIYLDTYLSVSMDILDYAPHLMAAYTTARVFGDRDSQTREEVVHACLSAKRDLQNALMMLLEIDEVVTRYVEPNGAALADASAIMSEITTNPHSAQNLGINLHEGVLWFDRDKLGDIVSWCAIIASIRSMELGRYETAAEKIVDWVRRCIQAGNESGYRVLELIRLLQTSYPSALRD